MIENKYYLFLGIIRRAGKLAVGYDSVIESLRKAKAVIIAEDASERLRDRMSKRCANENVKVINFGMSEKYAKALGLKAPVVLAVLDRNFSDALNEKFGDGVLFGGEINGEGKSL